MNRLILLGGFLLASTSLAAEGGVTREKQAAPLSEIERGFFFEARGGFWATVSPPGQSVTPGGTMGAAGFSPGQAAEIDLGVDIGERVSLALSLLGAFNRNGSDYLGLATTPRTATGDYSALVPGASAKIRIVGFPDEQGVSRTWLYVRLAGGAVFYSPKDLLPKLDALVTGGFGIEYFTRLRHFSVGLEANVNVALLTTTFGFSVLPTLKYSF